MVKKQTFLFLLDIFDTCVDAKANSLKVTRIHSSRMRTARLLTVSPSMHCSGGVPGSRGVYLVWGGVPGPGGVPDPGGVPGPRWF